MLMLDNDDDLLHAMSKMLLVFGKTACSVLSSLPLPPNRPFLFLTVNVHKS